MTKDVLSGLSSTAGSLCFDGGWSVLTWPPGGALRLSDSMQYQRNADEVGWPLCRFTAITLFSGDSYCD